MNAKKLLEEIEGNVGDVINNIDLVMASTQESQEQNNSNYELCVDSNDVSKKVNLKCPTLTLKITQKKIGGTTVMNATNRQGGGSETITSLNKKSTSDNSCNDKEDNKSEGENKGDKNDRFHANVNMSVHELGKGNVCLAEECGVADCEGQ